MQARDEPLSKADVQRIVDHMNDDHGDAVRLFAEVYADIESVEEAELLDIDADGMRLRVTTENATQDIRIPFERSIQTPDDAHRVLVDMAMNARDVANE
jgi:putative heme iron utilization protein